MNPLSLIGIILVIGSSIEAFDTADKEWIDFKDVYNKTYSTFSDEVERFKIFKKNCATFSEHNRKYELGIVTFKMGINRDADLTFEEIDEREEIEPE